MHIVCNIDHVVTSFTHSRTKLLYLFSCWICSNINYNVFWSNVLDIDVKIAFTSQVNHLHDFDILVAHNIKT